MTQNQNTQQEDYEKTVVKHKVLILLGKMLAAFILGLGTMWGIFEKTDMYVSKKNLKQDYMFISDCDKQKHDLIKSTTTIYLLGNDTTNIFTPSDKSKLYEKLEIIESTIPQEINIDELEKKDRLTIYYSELDRIVGQFELLKKLLIGKSLKELNDSLQNKFSEYNNLINNTK